MEREVHIVALIEIKEGKTDLFLDSFRPMVASTRQEPGCLKVIN